MKKALSLVLALAMTLSLAACGGNGGNGGDGGTGSAGGSNAGGSQSSNGGGNAGGETVTLKIAHVEAEDRSTHKALIQFKSDLEEKSGGRFQIEIYPNAELGGDEELCESVAMGTIQMALPSTSVLTAYNERIGILDMPYLFKDAQSAFNALDGALGDQISEWIAGNGFISLGYTYNGPRCTTNSVRPIYTPDDLKGLKIRVMSSPVFIDMYDTLGANTTPMSFSELFTGLQQNTVEGQENPPTLIYASGFQQVQKYLTIDNHVHNFLPILTNEAWFNGLSAEDQALVKECAADLVKNQREIELADNETIVEKLESEGMEVNYLTDEQYQQFVDAVQPMYEKYQGNWGTEIFDLATSFNS